MFLAVLRKDEKIARFHKDVKWMQNLQELLKNCIYLFLERWGRREKERERNIDQLPLTCETPVTLQFTD